jgi:subtilisin family serine protease
MQEVYYTIMRHLQLSLKSKTIRTFSLLLATISILSIGFSLQHYAQNIAQAQLNIAQAQLYNQSPKLPTWNHIKQEEINQLQKDSISSDNNSDQESKQFQALSDGVLANNQSKVDKGKIDGLLKTRIATGLLLVHTADKELINNPNKILEIAGLVPNNINTIRKMDKLSTNNNSTTFIIESPQLHVNQEKAWTTLRDLQSDSKYAQVHKKLIASGRVTTEADVLWQSNSAIPNDPFFPNQWHLNNTGQTVSIGSDIKDKGVENMDINYLQSLPKTKGNKKTIVAIIDDGVDTNHPDLKDNILRDEKGEMLGFDFTANRKSTTYDNTPMGWGHGTHVAGIIAAKNDDKGITGICGDCSILPIQFLGPVGGSTITAIKSIYYAVENGANIINMSWGSSYPSPSVEAALNYAHSKGVLLVASAGNSNSQVFNYPASYDNVMSVASTNNKGLKSSSSTYNRKVDISAPGQHILSTFPKEANMAGSKLIPEPNTCQDSNFGASNDGYGYCSGTSMSAPVVSGVAALIKSQNPTWQSNQIAEHIKQTAKKNLETDIADKMGVGIVDLTKALETSPSKKLVFNEYVVNIDNTKTTDLIEKNKESKITLNLTNPWLSGDTMTLKLTSSDPRVKVINDTAIIQPLVANNTLKPQFTIAVDNNFSSSENIKLNLSYTVNDQNDNIEITLPVDVIVNGSRTWNFNTGTNEGWQVVGQGWNLANNCNDIVGTSQYVWHFGKDKCSNYEVRQDSSLISPRLNLDPNKSYKLTFDSWLDNEFYNEDQGKEKVEIADFATVYLSKTRSHSLSDAGDRTNHRESIFKKECARVSMCGKSQWEQKSYYLPTSRLKDIEGDYRLQFVFGSDHNINKKGWYIKNIQLLEENNLPTTITNPKLVLPDKKGDKNININLDKEAGIINPDEDTLRFTSKFIKGSGTVTYVGTTGDLNIKIDDKYEGSVKLQYTLDDNKGSKVEGIISFNYAK